MPTEEEKRLHRCCFSGHRLEKLEEPEEQIKVWLETQIRAAIASGFTTFISGCAMGVDISHAMSTIIPGDRRSCCSDTRNRRRYCASFTSHFQIAIG